MKIIYTFTDEAPALATRSLLPIIQRFSEAAGIDVETRDISLAGQIICELSGKFDGRPKAGRCASELGELQKHRGQHHRTPEHQHATRYRN